MKFFEKLMMEEYLNEAPIASRGWTSKSIEKFEKTLGKKADSKGFFDVCVKRMQPKMGDQAKGFCAAIKDAKHGSTYWRNKKTKKEVKKAVKEHPYKEKEKGGGK